MAEKAKSNSEMIFIIITLILMIGFGFIPPVLDLTPSGMRILGVLFGVIFGCSFCSSTAWPCLLGMVVLIMTGVSNAATVLSAGIGNDSIWLMTFFFVFVAVLEEAQITALGVSVYFDGGNIFCGRYWLVVPSYDFILEYFDEDLQGI